MTQKSGELETTEVPEAEPSQVEHHTVDPEVKDETVLETKVIPMKDRTRGLPPAKQMLQDILKHRGWDKRGGQVKMVRMIQDALDDGDWDAIINAPVGIGKSLAYLVSVLPADRHALICTSTKALQDQLIDSELPDLANDLKALYDYDLSYQVIKGKANYICMDAAERILSGDVDDDDDDLANLFDLDMEDAEDFKSWDPQPLKDLIEDIKDRMARAKAGEVGVVLDCGDKLAQLPSNIRNSITASKCINHGGKWWDNDKELIAEAEELGLNPDDVNTKKPLPHPHIIATRDCPLGLAYALSIGSDVAVLNTSLLAAELQKSSAMPYPTMATQIRGVDTVIVDEAHHLVNIITNSMRIQLNIDRSLANTETLIHRIARKFPEDEKSMERAYKQYALDFRNKAGDLLHGQEKGYRGAFSKELFNFKDHLVNLIERSNRNLTTHASSMEDKEYKAVTRNISRLQEDVIEPIIETAMAMTRKSELEQEEGSTEFTASYSYNMVATLDQETENWSLDLVPIDISFLRAMFEDARETENIYLNNVASPHFQVGTKDRTSLILCSGTITETVAEVIGIDEEDYEYLHVGSPFDDYASRIFIPSGTPKPDGSQEWFDFSSDLVERAVGAMGGRTLVLTTSSMMSDHYAFIIQNAMNEGRIPKATLRWQGGPWTRKELLDTMAEDETSVLVGTKGFWEGVNIPGISLAQVIIDKIPFPMRDDAAVQARRKFVERRGGNAFQQVDVDMAAIDLEQGRGRLIRSVDDIGGVIIMDCRAADAGYASKVTKLFPGDMLVTHNEDTYLKWVDWVNPDNNMDQDVYPSEKGWKPLRQRSRRR